MPFESSKRTKGQVLRVLIWQVWEENHRSLSPQPKSLHVCIIVCEWMKYSVTNMDMVMDHAIQECGVFLICTHPFSY
jgi:hypothetical protein